MIAFENLPQVVDSLDEALYFDQPLTREERVRAGSFLLSRQLTTGPHAGLFGPSAAELEAGITLFTGERLHTHLGPRNLLSADVGRLCLQLDLAGPGMGEALERLRRKLLTACYAADLCTVGECAQSGLGWMRYLSAGAIPGAAARLEAHLRLLAAHRDGRGRWKRFPFHYTLLVLGGIELPAALEEMRYAAPAVEKSLRRQERQQGNFALRRRVVCERLLARC